MARSFSEILQSAGIGVKSDAQKQRESNPGMNQFGTRGGPNYADIKAQEEINRKAGVNLKRFDGKLKSGEKIRNIGGVSYVVPAISEPNVPVQPSTPYTPQSFNPQVEGVQALSPFGMFGTEFTPLEDRVQPETVKDVVTQELKKVREEETAREESPYGYGLMQDAGFKTEPRERIDLRTKAKTFDRPGDDAGDSFFKIDQFGEGAPDAAAVAGLNTGEFSHLDEFKYLPSTGKSLIDRTGRTAGMDLLYGLLDIRGKAGPETPEQQARADAAEEVKNELLEKQFIAQELVNDGIIDRRQVSNPASVDKINEIYKQREEDPFRDNTITSPVSTGRKGLVADLYEAANIIEPITDVTSAYQQNMVDADKKRAEENKSEGLFTSTQEQLRRFMAKRKEKEEKEANAFDVNAKSSNNNEELMALGEAMGIDVTELPAEVVSPPAISRQARVVGEPVIEKAVDTIGFNEDEWEAYKQGVADIESSGGDYTATSGQHLGKYQMNNDARADAAESMGIDNPSKKDFLANPKLQERMFAEYTRRNYLHLMQKSTEFRAMSEKEKYSTLARAQLGAEALRKTLAGLTPDKIDANKTKSSKFKDAVEKRFNSIANDKGGFEGTGEF
ncbi:hypothetical protein N9Z85_06200 [Akkermansiaceae bacterium]|nr:hypothetical protein [Akkermansiaceae bacterium]